MSISCANRALTDGWQVVPLGGGGGGGGGQQEKGRSVAIAVLVSQNIFLKWY